MEGHLFAPAIEDPDLAPPFVALLVSGGHTLLLDVPAWGRYRLLGQTRDDAAGEAFDKVATLLGLEYPGGQRSSGWPRTATRRASRSRARCGTTGLSSRSPGSRPPCCTRSGRAAIWSGTGHTWPGRSRTRCSTCSSPSWSAPCAPPATERRCWAAAWRAAAPSPRSPPSGSPDGRASRSRAHG